MTQPKPSDMTDAELTDALAIEVMGYQPYQVGMWWTRISSAPVEFDPLRDHNHMAIPRAEMRERGLYRTAFDTGTGDIEVSYSDIKCIQRGIATHKDELRAEGEAMLEAARKEAT